MADLNKIIEDFFENKNMIAKIEERTSGLADDTYEADHIISLFTFTSTEDEEDVFIKDIKPKKGETEEEFISRFMKATKAEYPDKKQRLAVAYSYWENRK